MVTLRRPLLVSPAGRAPRPHHRPAIAPPWRGAVLALLLLPGGLAAQTATDPPPSPAELRKSARSAEAAYERTARWLAPTTFAGGGRDCEEVVGRFCLTFDTLSEPPKQAERREVAAARQKAIAAAERYFAAAPRELEAAAPLIRLLVEDGRAAAAVAAARQFAQQGDSILWREWLLGFALHASGEDSAAAHSFQRALEQLPVGEREEIESIEWLLDPPEHSRLRKLEPAAHTAYVRRFWSIADPTLATDVNELWVQHVARHVEARIRARIPRTFGMTAWGRDLDQLTVRYGSPTARERVIGRVGEAESFIEHFDTAALAFAPRALLRDGLQPPAPGERWTLGERAPRSAHAIPALPDIRPLAHQLTRYPRGDSMLVRIDAAADSGGERLEALLVVLDAAGERVAERRTALEPGARQLTLELTVARDSLLYGAEIHDSARRRLHRARYALDPLPAGPLQLSDLLITAPLHPDSTEAEPLPFTQLELTTEATLAVHADIHGVAEHEPYEVDVGFRRADRPSALTRGLNWLGSRLGIVRERTPARVRWIERAATRRMAINLAAPARPGDYFIEVRVRAGGHQAASRRLIRVLYPDP